MEENKKKEYNDIPVCYCNRCMSLRIRRAPDQDVLYCDSCGATSLSYVNIKEWDLMYRERHGCAYLTRDKNGRKNYRD